jgi:outer membrane protein TolC
LLKDVLQAQVQLEQANNQGRQALLSFWTAKAEFENAIGEDK